MGVDLTHLRSFSSNLSSGESDALAVVNLGKLDGGRKILAGHYFRRLFDTDASPNVTNIWCLFCLQGLTLHDGVSD